MKKAIPSSIKFGFFFGLLILSLSALLPYHNFKLLRDSEDWVAHTMKVLQASDALTIALTNAESAQRAYLLTNNELYLRPYEDALEKIPELLASLATQTQDNSAQRQRLQNILGLIEGKLAELKITVELKREAKDEEALNVADQNEGIDLTRQFREALNEFQATERNLLEIRTNVARSHQSAVLYSFLLITFFNICFFLALYLIIIKILRERRAAQLVSSQQSDLLASIINTMSEGVYVIDTKRVTLVQNPRLAEIYGDKVSELGPDDWQRAYSISNLDGTEFLPANFPAVKVLNGETVAVSEMLIRPTNSDQERVVRVSATPLYGKNGELAGAVCISTDVSEQKKIELKLRFAMEQAELANKAKGNFVANMSHEIRTPLNAVLGTAQLLMKTALSREQLKYLDMIIMSGQMLLNVLNDILDFSKIEAGKLDIVTVQFRLNDLVHSLAAIMTVAAGKKNIDLVIDMDPEIPSVLMGDAHRLQQVLVNLVSNAIKFTERGKVAVILRCSKKHGDQFELHIAVTDTGLGITREQQDRLFSAFTQADDSITRRFGGTGLGLTICHRLVELMDGSLSVQSTPGVGSEFSVEIPLVHCQEIEKRAYPRNNLGKLKLLIVQENEFGRLSCVKAASVLGWHSEIASSSSQCLAYLTEAGRAGDKFDAVLLDWRIVSDDPDTVSQVKALTQAPVVVMSNLYGQALLDELIAKGVINKPACITLQPVTCLSLFGAMSEVFVDSQLDDFSKQAVTAQPLLGTTILMAEDNEFNQVVARDLLQIYGASVDIVDNGQKVLDVLRANRRKYDLILMDVQMPIMDGFTATRIIRSELQSTLPIIAMTAGVTEHERESCLHCGMDDLIPKPIEAEKMINTILRNLTGASGESAIHFSNPETPADSGYFDVTRLLALGASAPGYKKKTVTLVSNLIKNSMTTFEKAKYALKEGDAIEVRRILHTLRGSLGMIGATSFVTSALALEACLANGDRDESLLLFANLENEMLKSVKLAQDWIEEHRFQD